MAAQHLFSALDLDLAGSSIAAFQDSLFSLNQPTNRTLSSIQLHQGAMQLPLLSVALLLQTWRAVGAEIHSLDPADSLGRQQSEKLLGHLRQVHKAESAGAHLRVRCAAASS